MTIYQYPFSQSGADQLDGGVAPPGQVRMLRNCRLDRTGRITRTPAWDIDWYSSPDSSLDPERDHVLSVSRNWLGYAEGQYVRFAFLETGGEWVPHLGSALNDEYNSRRIVACEAPRTQEMPIHLYRRYHGSDAQIATTSVDGVYVLVTTDYHEVTDTYYLVCQPVSMADGLPVAHGAPVRYDCGGYQPFPKCVGPYICSSVETTGYRVTTYDPDADSWDTDDGGHPQHGRFDVCYSPDDTKLVFVSYDGYTADYNIAAGTFGSWTDRTGSFTSPASGSYAICCPVTGDYVWIACRTSTPAYHIRSFVYSTWAPAASETTVTTDVAIDYNFRPELARCARYLNNYHVWFSARVTTKASTAYGSLYISAFQSNCTERGVEVLADVAAATNILAGDETANGRVGSWIVVHTLRQYARQAWLLWLDPQWSGDYTIHTGATYCWRYRVARIGWNAPGSLLYGKLSEDECGSRSGLIWGGTLITDGSGALDAYQRDFDTCMAVATVYGMSGWVAPGGSYVFPDWAWTIDDADARVPELLTTCTANGVDMLAAGVVPSIAARPESSGVLEQPQAPELTELATGTLASGTYRYLITTRFVDSAGRLHLGPVSEYTEITTTAAHAVEIEIRGGIRYIGARDQKIRIYRTEEGPGSNYYLLYELGYDWFPCSDDNLTIQDSTTDAELITHRVLYTVNASADGNVSHIGGRLECWGAPPCRSIAAGTSRVVCAGLEQPNRYRLSNLFYPGEAIAFPEHGGFYGDLSEPIVAAGMIDDMPILWTRNGCFYVAGLGPDIQGNGEFDTPRQIATAPGCMSARSVVHAPEGVYWQGTDWQIWRIDRGSLQPVCVSQNIGERVYDPYHFGLDYGITDVAGGRRSYVVGAARDDTSGLVYFARRAAPNTSNVSKTGGTLVFDPANGSWSIESDTGTLAAGAGAYLQDGVSHPVVWTYLDSGSALPEDGYRALSPMPKDGAAGRFAEYNSYFDHDMIVDLGNVAPWESGGNGRIKRVGVIASDERTPSGSYLGAKHWTGFRFHLRYDGQEVGSGVYNVTPASPQGNAGRWLFQLSPPYHKCSELAPVLWLSNYFSGNEDAEVWLHALVVDAVPAPGVRIRRQAGYERAS